MHSHFVGFERNEFQAPNKFLGLQIVWLVLGCLDTRGQTLWEPWVRVGGGDYEPGQGAT